MPKIHLSEGELVRVFGPALLTISDGEVEVLGAKFGTGEHVVIHRLRSYTVLALKETVLDINMGKEGIIQSAAPEDPYLEWRNTAEELMSRKPETIMVIGSVDSGKSSIAILLSNIALRNNLAPAIIDGDMGQADIGPPGFVSLSYPEKKTIWMRTLKAKAMKFIGDIKPQGHTFQIVRTISYLIDMARREGRKPIIIDTDGWVLDTYATMYKSIMIEETRPSYLIVIGDQLYEIYRKYSRIGTRVIKVRPPTSRRERSREDRRYLRAEKYREYLDNSRLVKISLQDTILSGHPIFHGTPVEPEAINKIINVRPLYASVTPDTMYMVLPGDIKIQNIDDLKRAFHVQKIRCYPPGFERNAYVGVIGEDTDYPALIEKIDFLNKTIYMKTKEELHTCIIRFSKFKLTEEYHEIPLE